MAGDLLSLREILVVTSFLADDDVVAEIYLNGAIDEVQISPWLLIIAEFSGALVDFVDDMSSFVGLGLPSSEVVLIELIIDGGVVALGFAFISMFIDFDPLELFESNDLQMQFFSFLIDLFHALDPGIPTSKSWLYFCSSTANFF